MLLYFCLVNSIKFMRKDKSPMTLAEVFNLCQDIELRHAKLYATLSLLLGNVDERVARFWEQMSTEEWQHYILVDFGRSLCARSFGLDTPATEMPPVSIQQITQALDKYEGQVVSEQVTLQEGFEIAIEIEGSEADTVYMYLLSIIRRAIYQSKETYLLDRISQIEKDMHTHIDHLIDATKRFAKDPELVRRAYSLKEHHSH
jgi:hypothetical protein